MQYQWQKSSGHTRVGQQWPSRARARARAREGEHVRHTAATAARSPPDFGLIGTLENAFGLASSS